MFLNPQNKNHIKMNNSVKKRIDNIFSWKEIRVNPFVLFNSENLIPQVLFDQENLDSKLEWAIEYELIYNSQLMEI